MKIVKTYSDILKSLNENKVIIERSMSDEKISKLKRLKDSGDFKEILNIINNEVDEILNKCKVLDYDSIKYSNKDDLITILYNNNIMTNISILKGKIEEYSSDEINDRIFAGGWRDIFLEIEIDSELFNRIDIINGLPNFMKGIGLGKKVYKKLIKDFNYISSFNGYEPSIDSSMVWNSLACDDDIFTFSKGENIISFWKGYNYEKIITILRNFYDGDEDNNLYDDTFLNVYNLTDKKLDNILFNI